jgi:multidrug efflux pump
MLVSGMIIGTSFTLFVVPAVYMFVAKNHRKDLEHRGERPSRTQERKLQPVQAHKPVYRDKTLEPGVAEALLIRGK